MLIGFRDRSTGKFDKFKQRDGSESRMKWIKQKVGQEEVNGGNEYAQLFQEIWLWSGVRERERASESERARA